MSNDRNQRAESPNRTYLHEYGAFYLGEQAAFGLPLKPDNDTGIACFTKLELQYYGKAKVIREGQEETIEGWVYKAALTVQGYPDEYRFFFFAKDPSSPNFPNSSYVGYSEKFDNDKPDATVFMEYRKNFTAHENL